MDETLLLLIISLFSSLVLVIVHFYLFLELKKKAFLIWGISWILYSLRYALALLLYTDRRNILFIILYQFPILWSGYFLFFGTFNFMDKSISKFWIIGPILGTLWILFFSFGIPIQIIELRDLIFLSLFPIFVLLGITNIYLGVIFIKKKGYDIAINKLTGFIFIFNRNSYFHVSITETTRNSNDF